jgi:hypothetical protein
VATVFTSGHTAGDTLVVFAVANSGTAWLETPSTNISNTLGYTWLIARGDCVNAGIPERSIIWYTVVPSRTASSDTITVTKSSSAFTAQNALEI